MYLPFGEINIVVADRTDAVTDCKTLPAMQAATPTSWRVAGNHINFLNERFSSQTMFIPQYIKAVASGP